MQDSTYQLIWTEWHWNIDCCNWQHLP